MPARHIVEEWRKAAERDKPVLALMRTQKCSYSQAWAQVYESAQDGVPWHLRQTSDSRR